MKMISPEIESLEQARQKIEGESLSMRQRRIGQTLAGILTLLGEIYVYKDQLYLFEKEEKVLYHIPSQAVFGDFEQYLIYKHNFSSKQTHGKAIYDQLYVALKFRAKPATVYTFSHYKKGKLYIRVSDSRMAVVTQGSVSYQDNSFDGVIFQKSSWKEDLPEVEAGSEADFIADFFERIWLDDMPKMPLSTQRFLFLSWFLFFIFNPAATSRPLLIMEGEQGTGKTSSLLAFGMLLFGENFTAVDVPKDIRDFHNHLLNNEFLIIDNFDESAPEQFIDQITRLTTGGGIGGRPLYNDVSAESIREKVNCSIAITTRTAKFNRVDLTARSIPLHLANFRDKLDISTDLHQYVLLHREKIWAGLLALLTRKVSSLDSEAPNFQSQFRMIDFERFCYQAFGNIKPERIYWHFANLNSMQKEFAMLSNKFVQAVREALEADEIDTNGKFYSTEKLHELLRVFGSAAKDVQHTGNSMSSFLNLVRQFVGVEPSRGYEGGLQRRGWKFFRLD